MEAPPPQVVDFERLNRIQEMTETPQFGIFNIVALVIIAMAAFFLYKRFKDKQASERAHTVRPSPIIEESTVVAEIKAD